MPPRIDGILDDTAWGGAAVDDNWISYDPLEGEELSQKTLVYLAYDSKNLYFAFHCLDSQPEKIKTSLTKRDGMFEDDWIGLVLDAVGNRQTAVELFVNPSGIQGDKYRTNSGESSAPDWVWHSAGKVTEKGYIVEIGLPLKNIRFTSGDRVSLGILFWRHISRTGMSGSWPGIPPGRGVFNSLATVIFDRLENVQRLEVLPALTYGSIWDRVTPSAWSEADDKLDTGVDLKYGLTSSINLETAYNPDFSQVESDEFQVEVNQRYPIFYEEKRPFFMEVGSIFNLSGIEGPNNMKTAVHTRNIVDPLWGVRLTGDSGPVSFAFLSTADEWPGRSWSDGKANPDLGRRATYWIGRAKYGLGKRNFLGFLYSGREFGGVFNRVAAGDFCFNFEKSHWLSGNFIQSFSYDPDKTGKTDGASMTLSYKYETRKVFLAAIAEHCDGNFRMESAYYQRTGFTYFSFDFLMNFFPSKPGSSWLKRISPFLTLEYLHDAKTGLNDRELMLCLDVYFSRNGNFFLTGGMEDESWQGVLFHKRYLQGEGKYQPSKWLSLESSFWFGNSIFYDSYNPYLGKKVEFEAEMVFQPNQNINLSLGYTYNNFRRDDTGEFVYDVNIMRGRFTYQFSKYLFARALVQYDSYKRVTLSDILLSYTRIPGTVLYVGYGSLHDNQIWLNSRWETSIHQEALLQKRQSLFLKISYRFQF